MQHQIFEPNPELAGLVKCYWTLESDPEGTPEKNTIVPDGTMKLIFHYGDLYKHHPPAGDAFNLPRCLLIGQLTKPYIVEPTGKTGTFFVRFHPYGFLPFTTIPIKEMENKAIPLEDLFGNAGKKIGQQILNANNTVDRIKIIESFLFDRLSDSKTTNHIVQSTYDLIESAGGQLPVDQLSKEINFSRRTLSRNFAQNVGLSPKQISKIVRLQSTLKALLIDEVSDLTALAYENEYYDQAHFIKDFKAFTGLTPKEFYGDNLKMSLIFDGDD